MCKLRIAVKKWMKINFADWEGRLMCQQFYKDIQQRWMKHNERAWMDKIWMISISYTVDSKVKYNGMS